MEAQALMPVHGSYSKRDYQQKICFIVLFMKLIFGNVQIFWGSVHRHLFHSKNICPLLFLTSSSTSTLFPFPTSPQYFSLICDPFADPIISLHSRAISLFDCHI